MGSAPPPPLPPPIAPPPKAPWDKDQRGFIPLRKELQKVQNSRTPTWGGGGQRRGGEGSPRPPLKGCGGFCFVLWGGGTRGGPLPALWGQHHAHNGGGRGEGGTKSTDVNYRGGLCRRGGLEGGWGAVHAGGGAQRKAAALRGGAAFGTGFMKGGWVGGDPPLQGGRCPPPPPNGTLM